MMNKFFIVVLLGTFLVSTIDAQMTNEGKPKSWSTKTILNPIDYYLMPPFDLKKQKKIDAINDAKGMKPWQFGYEHNVNYGLTNSGTWTVLPNGDRIWQIEFESLGALTMNLVFDDYKLPKGATVYLYNPKTKEYQGAYTSINNSPDRMLGTTLIQGDNVVIEYYEPKAQKGKGALNISMVVHGYRGLGAYPKHKLLKDLNDAGACHYDVGCPLGIGWEDQINSVALIIIGATACTGALINNTTNDGTPYFLSADHCGTSGLGAWIFRFNWDSPVAICAQTGNSVDPGGPYNEINGATLRANNAATDFSLMELNSTPTGNVYYAGWDRSSTPATNVTGIHHPSADVKKISYAYGAVTATISPLGSVSSWSIDNWDFGVTEGGSSGSPLFNQNGLIIGQLLGGGAACSGTSPNNAGDDYGRFDLSWTGNSAATRLKDWLDPNNSNVMTHTGYNPNGPGYLLDAGIALIGGIERHYCNIDSFKPEVTIRNYGSDTINTVEVIYNLDGSTNSTYTWNGSLPPNTLSAITLPTITATAGTHAFNVSTTLPNGSLDSNAVNDARSFNFVITLGGIPVEYVLATDCYGSETTWALRDSATGTLLYSGGPYSDNFVSQDSFFEEFCLSPGCYSYTVYDDYSDGFDNVNCGYLADYWIRDAQGNDLVRMTNPNFGASAVHYFCVPSVNLNTNVININKQFKVFPNPTDGNVHISLNFKEKQDIQLELYTVTGQLLKEVRHSNALSNRFQFDLGDYSAGVYFVKLKVDGQIYAKKIIKQ